MNKSLAQLRAEKGLDIKVTAEKYSPAEGNLTTGNTAQIDLSGLDAVTSVEISNDTSGKDLLVSINGGSNFTIKGEESKTIENVLISNLLLTNSSGSTIAYRVISWGV